MPKKRCKRKDSSKGDGTEDFLFAMRFVQGVFFVNGSFIFARGILILIVHCSENLYEKSQILPGLSVQNGKPRSTPFGLVPPHQIPFPQRGNMAAAAVHKQAQEVCSAISFLQDPDFKMLC